MGNFCSQCGRELQDGEICNCTQQNEAQPQAQSQIDKEVKNGFQNLLSALKVFFKNPQEAAEILAKSENWLIAICLIAAQAVLSGLFALATMGIGLGALSFKAADLAIVFFFTFICSLLLSAAMMGIILGLGKAVKGTVDIKSALSLTSIRSFVNIPLSVIAILFTMLNATIGFVLFTVGEFFVILLIFMAMQKSMGISANKAFLITGIAAVVLLILFLIMFTIYCNINAVDLMSGGFQSSIEDSMDDLFDNYY